MEKTFCRVSVSEICKGFRYDKKEEKGVFGWNGKLTIQPEYQRCFVYADQNKEIPVIESLLKGYPLGLFYFVETEPGKYEILDGQQRITSLGRFLTGQFSLRDNYGGYQFENLDDFQPGLKEKIASSLLDIYICKGEEKEIKEWFQIINTAGIQLTEQEKNNAIYSGPFVTECKKIFSRSNNPQLSRWLHYMHGDVKRQEILEVALDWVSNHHITDYMKAHRYNPDTTEITQHFESVIGWVESVFVEPKPEMSHIKWSDLYLKYHDHPYDIDAVSAKVEELYLDGAVKRSGIWEYILGGCEDKRLLHIRIFPDRIADEVYKEQTVKAEKKHLSNCPDCVTEKGINLHKIWLRKEMEADHVTAWSNGGETTKENCQMLCVHHNRLKGNS